MHLARLTALDYKSNLRACAFANQVMMYAGYGEQRRYWRQLAGHVAVRQKERAETALYGSARLAAHIVERPFQTTRAFIHFIDHWQSYGFETRNSALSEMT